MERYLSANSAGRVLGVTAQAVHQMAKRGDLPVAAETESGIRLFRRVDVEHLATVRAGVGHVSGRQADVETEPEEGQHD
jgi:hypothetical protein